MTIYLASGNRHKQEEFAAILKDYHVILPADAGIAFDPKETGATFLKMPYSRQKRYTTL